MTGTDLYVNKPHCAAAVQCSLFTYKSVPVIYEPPCIRRVINQIIEIMTHHFCQLYTKFYPTSCCQDYVHKQRNLSIISVDFDTTDQLLIIYSAFVKYFRKNGNTMNQCISSLYS